MLHKKEFKMFMFREAKKCYIKNEFKMFIKMNKNGSLFNNILLPFWRHKMYINLRTETKYKNAHHRDQSGAKKIVFFIIINTVRSFVCQYS